MEVQKKDPKLIAFEIKAKSQEKQNAKNVKVSRIVLLFVTFMQCLRIYIFIYGNDMPLSWIYPDLIIGVFFIVVSFLSFKKPLLSFILAVSGYVGIQLYLASFDIVFVYQGWIWKVMILTALIIGLNASRKLPSKQPEDNDLLDV